jgi:hypothetical protein
MPSFPKLPGGPKSRIRVFRKGSLRSLPPPHLSSCFDPRRIRKKRDFYPQIEKITTNRREPGGRREDEGFIKLFVFLTFRKKNLCGLCVLSGSILSFIPGGYGDFYNFLCNEKNR